MSIVKGNTALKGIMKSGGHCCRQDDRRANNVKEKKSLTIVQGLKKDYNYLKIFKDLKKEFCCNGNVIKDNKLGKIIQLQGDQRKNVSHFLVQAGLVKKDHIKIHGY